MADKIAPVFMLRFAFLVVICIQSELKVSHEMFPGGFQQAEPILISVFFQDK